jgi:hypothetical protein
MLDNATANYAIGENSLESYTTGVGNVAISTRSLRYLTTGNNNLAIGTQALAVCIAGNENCSIGNSSLQNYNGSNSASIGPYSGISCTSGNDNVFIGNYSGASIVTSSSSVYIGNNAGSGMNGTVNNCVFIGVGSTVSPITGTKTNIVCIGDSATATSDNDFILGSSSHNVKIPGTLTVTGNLTSNGTNTFNSKVVISGIQSLSASQIITFSTSTYNLSFPCPETICVYNTSASTLNLPTITASNVGARINVRRVNRNATTTQLTIGGQSSQPVITSTNTAFVNLSGFSETFYALPQVNNSPAFTVISSATTTDIIFNAISPGFGSNTATVFSPSPDYTANCTCTGTTLSTPSSVNIQIGKLVSHPNFASSVAVYIVSGSGTTWTLNLAPTTNYSNSSTSFYAGNYKTAGTVQTVPQTVPNLILGDFISCSTWTLAAPYSNRVTAITYTNGRPSITFNRTANVVASGGNYEFYTTGFAPFNNTSSLYAIGNNLIPDGIFINITWNSFGIPSGTATSSITSFSYQPVTYTLINYPLTYAWFQA